MNAIFRIVWNVACRRWVVASELARGRKKSGRSAASHSEAKAVATGALALLMLAHPGHATDYTITNNVDVTKTTTILSPATAVPVITRANNDTLTVTNTGALTTTGTATAYAIQADYSGFTGNTVTINNSGNLVTAGSLTTSSIFVNANTVNLTNTANITTGATGDAGSIYVRGAGNFTIVSRGDLTAQRYAISATSTGGAVDVTAAGILRSNGGGGGFGSSITLATTNNNASLKFESGSISSGNTSGRGGINVSATGGTASVQTGAGTTIDTVAGGNNATGMLVSATNISIVNHSRITTQGEFARGIWASATGTGVVTLDSDGDIATNFDGGNQSSGNESSALKVQTVDGNATLRASGNLGAKNFQSDGIDSSSTGLGSNNVTYGTGTISVSGGSSKAIVAYSSLGTTTVTAGGTLRTSGTTRSMGIQALSGTNLLDPTVTTKAAGDARANFTGDVATTGVESSGVYVAALGVSGNAIIDSSGTVSTTGRNAAGLQVRSHLGAASITNTGNITTRGVSAAAIEWNYSNTAAGISAEVRPKAGSVTTRNSSATVSNSGTISTFGTGSHGIYAKQSEVTSTGGAVVSNTGAITVNGVAPANGILAENSGNGDAVITGNGAIASVNVNNTQGHGVYALTRQAGEARIDYSGNVTTQGNDASGLRAKSDATGKASVNYAGTVEVFNDQADAILAYSTRGAVDVAAQGQLTTHARAAAGEGAGFYAYGIAAVTESGPSVHVSNRAAIDVNGNNSAAILATSNYQAGSGVGSIAVENAGALTVRGPAAGGGADGGGIMTSSLSGVQSIVNSGGITTFGLNTRGINAASSSGSIDVANSGAITTANVASHGIHAQAASAPVNVSNTAAINTARSGSIGIRALSTTNAATVTNAAAGVVHGGGVDGAGVVSGGTTQTLINAGNVDALSDRAIVADSGSAGLLGINNTGTLTGTVTASTSTATLLNAGQWNLRKFADTDGNGTRDTLAVAVSDFGTSGANTVNNTGTLALLTHDGTATTLDTTGMYLPFGNAANTMALNSPAQGQLLGVQTFSHSGVIDLQANPDAGDVLVISGGHTAGTDGGGVFVSNGGTLKLDTVLNEGGAGSISDVLVLDSTQVGSGATGIAVNNLGGAGAQTVLDGIPVVEVLNKSASAPGAFALNGRAVAGAYDYLLFQGGSAANGGNAGDGNWYLRSELQPCEVTNTCPPPPEPPVPPQPPVPPAPDCTVTHTCPVPIIRPEVGAYLGNQVAAIGLFQHTLHDRLGEVDFSERQRRNDGHPGAAWARVQRDQFDSTAGRNQIEVGTDSSLVQLGAEWDRWTDRDQRWHLGAMLGWGRADSQAQSVLTGYRARGDVEGTLLGLYGTWYQSASEATGLYVDGWVQYGWFRNRVRGDLLPMERYDSDAWAASLEAGYAFELHRNEKRAYYLEPQAQVIVGDYADDVHREVNGTQVRSVDTGSVTTRLGARAYARPDDSDAHRVQPFVEANWWHHNGHEEYGFNQNLERLERSADTYEVKLGAQVELGHRWTGWGHLGLSDGDGEYRNVEGLVGVKYGW